MRIGMVLDRVFPPDIRVEKEVRALTAAGHSVFLLCYARSGPEAAQDVDVPGLTIWRLKRSGLLVRAWDSYRFARTFYRRRWALAINGFIKGQQIEALHVHDLPLLPTAHAVAVQYGVPVIADLHENYPTLAGLWLEDAPWWQRAILPEQTDWAAMERTLLPECARVIVVVKEAMERLTSGGWLDPDRVCTVMNTEDPEHFARDAGADQPPPDWTDRFVILYTGGGGTHRGLETAVEAMARLGPEVASAHLAIVGVSGAQRDALVARATSLGVGDRVELHGWQPLGAIPGLIRAASVCLVPHERNYHTNTTIPHKLFQYMLAARPVIVSNCAPLERIVKETGSGLVFTAGNPDSLAEQIRTLYRDRALRERLAASGQAAAAGRYAWKHDAARLCDLYASLPQPD